MSDEAPNCCAEGNEHWIHALGPRMATMLRKLEWAGGDAGDRCPVCFRRDPNHAPNCDLASLLKDLP